MTDLTGWDNIIEESPDGNGFFTNSNAVQFMSGKNGYFFDMNCENNHLRAYNECAPLKAIVSKRAEAFNNGKLSIVDKDDKPTSDKSALAILEKLSAPNPLQTRSQFMGQLNTYVDLFGYCPVLVVTPQGRPDAITNIWCIPPWLFDLRIVSNWLFQTNISEIYSDFMMGTIKLSPDNLKIIFDNGIGTELDGSLTIPDSRLKGLEYDIANIIGANKSNHKLITRRGPMGILSNETTDATGSLPMREPERKSLQNEFKRYGLTDQEYQVIISQSNLKWQGMGFSVADLQLPQTINNSIKRICDAYSTNFRLFSFDDSANYNDVKEFKKDFYQGGIIPSATLRYEQLTKALLAGTGLRFKIDYSHVPELQADLLQLSQAKEYSGKTLEREFKNNLITLDMWRFAAGYEEMGGKYGKLYYWELLLLGFVFGSTTSTGDSRQGEVS